jgi:hypothetical protein
MIMKKHLLGFCVALFIFCGFLYVLPINFGKAKSFSYSMPDTNDCFSQSYNSNRFEKVVVSNCNYETAELAAKNFRQSVQSGDEIIGQTQDNQRAVIAIPTNAESRYFSIIKQNGKSVITINSFSLKHVLELERQNY